MTVEDYGEPFECPECGEEVQAQILTNLWNLIIYNHHGCRARREVLYGAMKRRNVV